MIILGLLGASRSGKSTAAEHLIKLYSGGVADVTSLQGIGELALAGPMKTFLTRLGVHHDALFGPSDARNARIPDTNVAGGTFWQNARQQLRKHGPAWLQEIFPLRSDHAQLMTGLENWLAWAAASAEEENGTSARFLLQTLGTEFGRSVDPYVWVDTLVRTALQTRMKFCVVSDVRFENELRFFRRQGHPVWWIRRPADSGATVAQLAGVQQHPSEVEQQQKADAMQKLCTAVISNDGSLPAFHKNLAKALWAAGL